MGIRERLSGNEAVATAMKQIKEALTADAKSEEKCNLFSLTLDFIKSSSPGS